MDHESEEAADRAYAAMKADIRLKQNLGYTDDEIYGPNPRILNLDTDIPF